MLKIDHREFVKTENPSDDDDNKRMDAGLS